MRKSVIAATFGGVLAAGFLTVSAPVAHAYPLCDPNIFPGGPPAYYQICEQNCAQQGGPPACFSGAGRPQAPAPPVNPAPADQCRYASQQSGIPCYPGCPC